MIKIRGSLNFCHTGDQYLQVIECEGGGLDKVVSEVARAFEDGKGSVTWGNLKARLQKRVSHVPVIVCVVASEIFKERLPTVGAHAVFYPMKEGVVYWNVSYRGKGQ